MRRRAASSKAFPAPTGGWDTSTPQAEMAEDRAILMENWFPDTDRVVLRKGSAEHVTGIGALVETLMTYRAEDGTEQLFAIADGDIYDVTSPGTAGSPVVTGLSNSRWEWTQFGTAGGQYLIAVNGVDAPRLYDGTTWSTTSITGPTQANFTWVAAHQRRLWFGLADSLTVYYLAVDSIAGAATAFYLGPLAASGGSTVAMGTWTRDGGEGMDDACVFVTTQGELFLYTGTNPADASTWSMVGIFRLGRPLGKRCLTKLGGELVLLTEDGVLPMSKAISAERSQQGAIAFSKNINSAVNDAVRLYRTNHGWQPIVHSAERQLIINIPVTSTTAEQFVFNTISGAATKFTGWNARCFAVMGNDLYYGNDGVVYKANTGATDNGSAIEADCIQAFSYFSSPSTNKYFKRVDVLMQSIADPSPSVQVYTDFNMGTFIASPSQTPTSVALWGSAIWGTSVWGSAGSVWRAWRIVEGYGRAGALRLKVSTTVGQPAWMATHWTYLTGGSL